ncbi:MAG: hypothetical protein R2806_12050 [Saprospiraceae bacterium]
MNKEFGTVHRKCSQCDENAAFRVATAQSWKPIPGIHAESLMQELKQEFPSHGPTKRLLDEQCDLQKAGSHSKLLPGLQQALRIY